MSEGLSRIAKVIKILGWLWLALFVVLACVFGYGRERQLTRDEQIALYEQQTHKMLSGVRVPSDSSVAPPRTQRLTVDEWINGPATRKYEVTAPDGSIYEVDAPEGASSAEVVERVRNQILNNHFKGKTPTTRDAEWFAALGCIAAGLVGFGIAFALAWIVNGFALDKSRR